MFAQVIGGSGLDPLPAGISPSPYSNAEEIQAAAQISQSISTEWARMQIAASTNVLIPSVLRSFVGHEVFMPTAQDVSSKESADGYPGDGDSFAGWN
jgi:hypothetical protein